MKIFGVEIKKTTEDVYKPNEFKRVCDMCGVEIYTRTSSGGVDSKGESYGHHFCSNGEMGNLR